MLKLLKKFLSLFRRKKVVDFSISAAHLEAITKFASSDLEWLNYKHLQLSIQDKRTLLTTAQSPDTQEAHPNGFFVDYTVRDKDGKLKSYGLGATRALLERGHDIIWSDEPTKKKNKNDEKTVR